MPGKKWSGERLVFRMPYETLMKITKARAVALKMDGVEFPFSESAVDQIRVFEKRLESQ